MTQPDPSAPSGAPDQPGAQSGAPTGGDGTTNISTTDAGAQGGTTTTNTNVNSGTVSREEFDRVVGQFRNQLSAADKKRADAEGQLQQLRDKDVPEMDRLKRDNAAHVEEINRLKAQAKDTAVQLAFLKENTVKWKDASAALKLADMSDVIINDDGTVTGLKIAMEKLAKSMPFLVDSGTPEGQNNTDNASTGGQRAPAGGVPPMNGRSTTQQPATSGLSDRLPAMRSRMRRNAS